MEQKTEQREDHRLTLVIKRAVQPTVVAKERQGMEQTGQRKELVQETELRVEWMMKMVAEVGEGLHVLTASVLPLTTETEVRVMAAAAQLGEAMYRWMPLAQATKGPAERQQFHLHLRVGRKRYGETVSEGGQVGEQLTRT